jgi:hypothetical protein
MFRLRICGGRVMATEESIAKAKQKRKAEMDTMSADKGARSDKPGYCNPPKAYQWPKGTSGNPNGRPKGRRSRKSIMKEIIDQTYTINLGNSQKELDLLSANLLAHGLKGAKGDVRSFNSFMKAVEKFELFDKDGFDANLQKAQMPALAGQMNTSSPAEALFDNMDQTLLSREEMIEMSRLAQVIELGGDFTALSVPDFTQLKTITEKGRGKDVTPSA